MCGREAQLVKSPYAEEAQGYEEETEGYTFWPRLSPPVPALSLSLAPLTMPLGVRMTILTMTKHTSSIATICDGDDAECGDKSGVGVVGDRLIELEGVVLGGIGIGGGHRG